MTAVRARPQRRALLWQLAFVAALAGALLWVASNVAANAPRLNLQFGFGFLWQRAGLELNENWVGYTPDGPLWLAFAAGIANTLQVAALGIVLTVLLGTAVALLRLSSNPLASWLAWLWVELFRNLPLLLILLFWHQLLVRTLPPPRRAFQPVEGVFLSNRGLVVPALEWQPGFAWALLALLLSVLAVTWLRRRVALPPPLWPALALAPAVAVLVWAGDPVQVSVPALRGFNFVGGATLSPEFVALLIGLVTYQSAFAAETIRSGLQGVPKGQVEAACALGLSRAQVLRLVVLPQALRIVIPPLTSQFLSLTKNSSLAVAIGYPEIVRVSTVAIGLTGRAVECIAIVLAIYLTLSLLTAGFMNWYNRRVTAQGA
jgi:general L-amino acid transport system permease protein